MRFENLNKMLGGEGNSKDGWGRFRPIREKLEKAPFGRGAAILQEYQESRAIYITAAIRKFSLTRAKILNNLDSLDWTLDWCERYVFTTLSLEKLAKDLKLADEKKRVEKLAKKGQK